MGEVLAEVLVLGQVAVRDRQRVVVPPGRTRAVLAMLALAGRDGLTDAELTAAVWSARAGEVCTSAVAVAVHRARRWLRQTVGDRLRIERAPGGFHLSGGRTDAAMFTHAWTVAADLPDERRADVLGSALGLWRGDPLTGVELGGRAVAMTHRLVRAHRDAVVEYGRTLLRIGRPGAAVDALLPLTEREPLDEPAHAALVEALGAAGRRAEALRCHERIRRALADELGVDPGAELDAALLRVLRDEPRIPATLSEVDRRGSEEAPSPDPWPPAEPVPTDSDRPQGITGPAVRAGRTAVGPGGAPPSPPRPVVSRTARRATMVDHRTSGHPAAERHGRGGMRGHRERRGRSP